MFAPEAVKAEEEKKRKESGYTPGGDAAAKSSAKAFEGLQEAYQRIAESAAGRKSPEDMHNENLKKQEEETQKIVTRLESLLDTNQTGNKIMERVLTDIGVKPTASVFAP